MFAADDVDVLEAGLGALDQAWAALQRGSEKEERSVRRLASSLHRRLESRKLDDLGELARALADAPYEELETRVPAFLDRLRDLVTGLPRRELRLLVVEDDPSLRNALEELLGVHGYQVRAVGNLKEARAILRESPPDLILLDLILPESGGRDFLVELREEPTLEAIPVVVMSRQAGTAATRTECFALGADKFLEKPVENELLVAAVSGTLRRVSTVTRLAQDDPLTGVPNRAGFQRVFEQVRALLGRGHRELSLAMLDLDLLKEVNDRLGHPAGDRVLRTLATVLVECLRSADAIGRWGGDEFVILFPDTGPTGARQALIKAQDRFRNALEGGEVDTKLGRIPTFSVGITEVESDQELEDAVAEADRSLYRAKSLGGGGVAVGGEPLEQTPKRVLVVEDDELDAALIHRVLRRDGFEPLRARGGEEALKMVGEERLDLVVLDLWLPDLKGFDVLAALQKRERFGRIPVLVLTADGSDDRVERSLELGAADYLVKPLAGRELLSRVRRLLRG